MTTHTVLNQPPPLEEWNGFTTDRALREACVREGAPEAEGLLKDFGSRVGSAQARTLGGLANDTPPVLRTHDRFGNRIDEVEFPPAWHELLKLSVEYGLHNLPWRDPRPGSHVVRAAMCYLTVQTESGQLCPLSMTYSAIPSLRLEPSVLAEWEPKILSSTYDSRCRPAGEKAGVLVGMAMTEKQGGSDVRANTTKATPVDGRRYRITGHKWFCSAPMCDAFLILAQAPGGLTCFLLPRWTPDGRRNAFYLQRLKNKLGNRSNASSEVEFEEAFAWRVGEEGRGVPTIIEMVTHTRLDCVLGSAGLMRAALVQALHHARHRSAFGKRLIEQPLMRNVLADLCLESEAATLLAIRLAGSFDRRDTESPFQRLATAAAKYWICKRAIAHVTEAMECLGGAGYVEESGLPRLYREIPLNSIWEGCGNVLSLDVLRAMAKEPECVDAVRAEIRLASEPRLKAYLESLDRELARPSEGSARRIVERLAVALQASLVARHSPSAVADAFLATRISGDWGRQFGTLPAGSDTEGLLERGALASA